jgi:hypothetical protein
MSPNETPNETPKTETTAAGTPAGKKKGSWRAKLVGCAVIVAALLAVMIAIGLNVNNIARFGFGSNINTISTKLENERFLTQEQYDELKQDIERLRDFVQFSPMDKDNVVKYRTVSDAFTAALEDGRIDEMELGSIRAVMKNTNLEFRRRSEADVKSKSEPRK